MDRFIARQNIEHYRQLLETITDEHERQKLLQMISEEEAKLKDAEEKHRHHN